MNTEMGNVVSIDKLCAQIGTERAVRVLEFALPHIKDTDRELQELLLTENREAAATCAHRAISSVRAYGTPRLEDLLRQVGEESSDLQQLQAELSAEFCGVIAGVEDWLERAGPPLVEVSPVVPCDAEEESES